jgi:hypothetical protein
VVGEIINLTTGDLADINAIAGAPLGILSLSIDVRTADLDSGTNTLELLPLNAPMDYPPVVADIDLLLRTSGSASLAQPHRDQLRVRSEVPPPSFGISLRSQ